MSGKVENRRCIISRKGPSMVFLSLNTLCFHFFDRVASGREGVWHTSIKTRSRTRGARLLDRARVTVVKSGSVTETRFNQGLVYHIAREPRSHYAGAHTRS